jgi:ABC-2 type transport system permease protein
VTTDEIVNFNPFGGGGLNRNRRQVPTGVSYVLAAHIRGKVEGDTPDDDGNGNGNGEGEDDHNGGEDAGPGGADADEPETEASVPAADEEPAAPIFPAEDAAEDEPQPEEEEVARPKREPGINVVLVADIDLLNWQFFRLREMGEVPEAGVRFDFDNVTFVLNALDRLAGDDRFLEIRKRRPKHRTLTRIEENMRDAREKTSERIEELRAEVKEVEEEENAELEKRVAEMEETLQDEGLRSLTAIATDLALAQQAGERRMQAKVERLKQETEKEIKKIQTDQALKERALQDTYKRWAVILPPILPLLVALGVFFTRRMREREGVARSRLRH